MSAGHRAGASYLAGTDARANGLRHRVDHRHGSFRPHGQSVISSKALLPPSDDGHPCRQLTEPQYLRHARPGLAAARPSHRGLAHLCGVATGRFTGRSLQWRSDRLAPRRRPLRCPASPRALTPHFVATVRSDQSGENVENEHCAGLRGRLRRSLRRRCSPGFAASSEMGRSATHPAEAYGTPNI